MATKQEEAEVQDKKVEEQSAGQQTSRKARDERFNRLEDRVVGMTREFAQLIAHQAKDNPELEADLVKVRNESSRESATRNFESRHGQIADEVLTLVQGEGDGSLRISSEDATSIQGLWSKATEEAQKTGDVSLLYEVKLKAQEMVATADRKQHEVDLEKEREESETKVKRALEKAGVHDLDTGAITGGGREERRGQDAIRHALDNPGSSRIQM